MIYVYTKSGSIIGHQFTDDAAVTFALTRRKAVKKFKRYYTEVNDSDVVNITPGLLQCLASRRIVILTDY